MSRHELARAVVSALALTVVSGAACAQSLQESLASSYVGDPRLLAERAALRAIDEGVSSAQSGWRPTVSINGSVGKRYQNNTLGTGVSSSNWTLPASADLSLSQPLWRGGAITAEAEVAENRVFAARANLVVVEQQVLLESATAYMTVVRDQSVVGLSINNERVLERQLQAARDRFEVGEITRTDVAQAEARLADTVAQRIRAEGNLEVSRADYQRSVGFLPGELAFPDLEAFLPLPGTKDEALAYATQRNPAIISAGFNDRAALFDISVAAAALMPQLSLDSALRRNWDPNSFFSETDTAEIIANVTVPLYQSGAEYARVRELQQTAVQRRRQLDDARRAVRKTAGQAWEELNAAEAGIRALKSSVNANEIALEGVRQEADVGARTVLDVLDAEQELFEARVALVRAETDAAVAAFRLTEVSGAMTAAALRLPVTLYDPLAHYDDVVDKWIGFGGDFDGVNVFDFGWE
ncbi:MAG TPA: TolC family outer membrane protein [Alphaproteobacteria bacterium]|nr:TolC family outer membrane protein [Alphaproteobacteria bacterium]